MIEVFGTQLLISEVLNKSSDSEIEKDENIKTKKSSAFFEKKIKIKNCVTL